MTYTDYFFNTSYYSSLKSTPFKALYGKDIHALFLYEKRIAIVSSVEERLESREAILDDLCVHLL